jgi:hypothetical protein
MESQSLTDEIKALKAELEERKGKRSELDADDPLYARRDLAYTEEITIKEKRLFWLEQQGKFASPISVVLFHSYR